MGKTPTKWLKNLLLGKKSSKSNLSKGREVLGNSWFLLSCCRDVNVDAPIISSVLVGPIASNGLGSEIEASAKLQNDEAITMSAKEDGSGSAKLLESTEDL
uniref:Uncharacterized protein n=1 Tax=Cannabis sativa TaxID=3483 RepID=A0A803QNN7_CANSA